MKIDNSWYEKPKDKNFPTRESAGGVVIRKDNQKLLIALVGDKKYKEYILPKGRLEVGENSESAAEREISEEAGLNDLEFICKLGIKERLTYKKKEWRITHYFLFTTNRESGIQKLEKGEKDYFLMWFDLDYLPEFFWPEQKELIEENKDKIKKLISAA